MNSPNQLKKMMRRIADTMEDEHLLSIALDRDTPDAKWISSEEMDRRLLSRMKKDKNR